MITKKYTALLLMAMAIPAIASAEDTMNGQNVTTLDEVVVTASRNPEPVKEVASQMTVISEEEIAASPAHDLGELLAEKGAGTVRKYPGTSTSIRIRGFQSDSINNNDLKSHILILLDGRRAGTGNLAKISTKNIERVEIIRGPGSVQYGTNAMGGVINVITKKGSGDFSAQLQSKIGSYGYNDNGFLLSGQQGNFDFSAGISRSTMDDYDTGSGEKFYNTGYDHIDSYSVNAGYAFLDTHRVGIIFTRYYVDEAGAPGYLNANDLDDTQDIAKHSFDLIYEGATSDRKYTWMTRYFWGKDKDIWSDPTASNPLFYNDGIPHWDKTDQDGAQAQASMQLGTVKFTTGIDWLKYQTESFYSPNQTEYENYAGFLLAKIKFMDNKLILDGGMRYDAYEVELIQPTGVKADDSNITSSVGLSYLLSDSLRLRSHYGEAFIMPGADQMGANYVSGWGTPYIGNPDLKPESSRTYEAGIDYSIGHIETSLNYFHTRFKDKIGSVSVGLNQSWDNLGKAEIAGFEGGLSWDLGAFLGWSYEVKPYVNFVYLSKYDDLDNNEELAYTTDWTASYGISAGDYEGFSARLNFSYSGSQIIDDYETWEVGGYSAPLQTITLGGFTVVDLTVSKKILDFTDFGSLTLTGEATNLFDKEYAYIKGYPMPGRSLFLGLAYNY